MRFIFDLLAMFSFGRLVDLICDALKSRSICAYVTTVERIRQIYLAGITTTFALLLFFVGFLLIHVALFAYAPFSETTKLILLLVLGGVYCIAPLILIGWLHSRKQWLERTGAQRMLDDAAKKDRS